MAKEPTKKEVKLPKGNNPIGDSGLNETAMNSNYTTEYLTELQGRQGSLNLQKMAKSDTQVGMILNVYKNPIKSANWAIPEIEDATPREKLATEILNNWFFEDYTLDFCSLMHQILSCLEQGYSAFERVYKIQTYNGVKYFVPTLQQRMQTSIENIYPDRGIIQQITIKQGLVDIPMENMVFFTLNRNGMDFRGESILRNAYSAWKKKNYYEENLGMGINRNASGIPHMEVPDGTDPDSDDYIATEALLKNMVMHENAYMITPKGYTFLLHESKFKPKDVIEVIQIYNTMMATSVLTQFLLLGQGDKGGAYALSRDQSDLFLDGLNHLVAFIEKTFHRQVIIPFLKINFGDSVDPSKIKLKGLNLNKKAGAELAEVLEKLTPHGYITATVEDEKNLRKALEMPDLTEEEIEERKEKQKNPPPVVDPSKPSEPQPKTEEEEEEGKVKDDDKKNKSVKLSEPKIKKRKELLDNEVKTMKEFMQANLVLIKDKFVKDLRNQLNKGSVEIRGLRNIEIGSSKYRKGLEMKLAGLANLGWKEAKKSAKANTVKLAENLNPKDLPDKELKEFTLNQAQLLTDDQIQTMKSRAIATASNGPIKGFSIGQTMANVEQTIDDFIAGQKVSVGAGLAVVGSINFGQNKFNKQISDQIWGYRFVAVDDDRTTQICSHYNGKTFSVDSVELSIATPPLHPNCRSYMEPIYKAVEGKPEILDEVAPPTIMKQKTVF